MRIARALGTLLLASNSADEIVSAPPELGLQESPELAIPVSKKHRRISKARGSPETPSRYMAFLRVPVLSGVLSFSNDRLKVSRESRSRIASAIGNSCIHLSSRSSESFLDPLEATSRLRLAKGRSGRSPRYASSCAEAASDSETNPNRITFIQKSFVPFSHRSNPPRATLKFER